METLVKNEKYVLMYNYKYVENGKKKYIVYFTTNPMFKQEVDSSEVLGKRFLKYFTIQDISRAKSRIHAIKYVSRKFK